MTERMTRDDAAAALGVGPDAAVPDVQRAFVRAARHVHPDALPDASAEEREDAAARFIRLTGARDVLLQPGPGRPLGGPAGGREPVRSAPVARAAAGTPGRPSSEFAGSLMVLTLLAFLMVAIVSVDVAVRTHGVGPAPVGVPSASAHP